MTGAASGSRIRSARPGEGPAGSDLREEISRLRGLLALSMLMTERRDPAEIVHLATTAIPALVPVRVEGVHVLAGERSRWLERGSLLDQPSARAAALDQLRHLKAGGGPLTIAGAAWSWAFGLPGSVEQIGSLIASADVEPSADDLLLLRSLAQQTGIALANAHLHAAHAAANEALTQTVAALRRTTAIHDRFTDVALAGGGQQGVVDALFELTGLAATVVDRTGRVTASAGPSGSPQESVPSTTATVSPEELVDAAVRAGRPVRVADRLLTIANPHPGVLAILMLVDPDDVAGQQDEVALEHGATVLAIELTRLHALAETELRLGRNLIGDLIIGDSDDAVGRAQALGHDLMRPHRVVALGVDPRHASVEEVLLRARDHLTGSARDRGAGPAPLLTQTGQTVVALVSSQVCESSVLPALLGAAGRGARMGVSGPCGSPDDIPRTHREAHVALRLAQSRRSDRGIVHYDDLGVYQLLAESADPDVLHGFVRRWLGALVDHDDSRGSDLVSTLAAFLAVGGNYDAAARDLTVGRSTVRYRVRRIQELSGHDLADPDTRFQLQLAVRAWATLTALDGP